MATVTQEYDFGVPAKRMRSGSGVGAPTTYYVPRGAKYRAPLSRYRRKVPKAVRAYVRSAIGRSLESKRAFINASNANILATITQSRCYSCVPAIGQGTNQGSRVGNSIKLKKVQVRMQIMGAVTTSAATYVDIYVFRRKPNTDMSQIHTNFLQAGSTAIGYDGDSFAYSGMLKLNEDMYEQCLHKRVKVWNPSNTANVGVQASIDPCYTCVLDITKFMKKTVTYNDSSTVPTSDDVYFAVGSTFVNGLSSGGSVTNLLTYVIEAEYTDA